MLHHIGGSVRLQDELSNPHYCSRWRFKNAISAAKADGLEAGWLVVSVIAALFVMSIVKRLLR